MASRLRTTTVYLNSFVMLFNQVVRMAKQMVATLQSIDTDVSRGIRCRDRFHKKMVEAFNELANVVSELPDDDSFEREGYRELVVELSRQYLAMRNETEHLSRKKQEMLACKMYQEAYGIGGLAVATFLHHKVTGETQQQWCNLRNVDYAVTLLKNRTVGTVVKELQKVRDLEDTLVIKQRHIYDLEDSIHRQKKMAYRLEAVLEKKGCEVQGLGRTALIADILRYHSLLDRLQAKICPATCPDCPRGPTRVRPLD